MLQSSHMAFDFLEGMIAVNCIDRPRQVFQFVQIFLYLIVMMGAFNVVNRSNKLFLVQLIWLIL
ncbi:MAG: hypothetical protein CMJ88_14175 [Planctomycetes bacterium]|nr:hypothetical protein [Planctomycetota bacterium]